MFLVPYDKMVLFSKLNADEIVARLQQAVGKPLGWFQFKFEKEYYGKVSNSGFSIVRFIKGRNTYLPLVRGQLEPQAEGTQISVTFSLHPTAMLFLVALVGWVQYVFISVEKQINIGLTLTMLVMHCIFYIIGYLPEKKKAEVWLANLLANSGT